MNCSNAIIKIEKFFSDILIAMVLHCVCGVCFFVYSFKLSFVLFCSTFCPSFEGIHRRICSGLPGVRLSRGCSWRTRPKSAFAKKQNQCLYPSALFTVAYFAVFSQLKVSYLRLGITHSFNNKSKLLGALLHGS